MAKKSREDYDGVIYEPSDYIDLRRNRRPSGANNVRSTPGGNNAPAAMRKKSSQSQFTIFYILTTR